MPLTVEPLPWGKKPLGILVFPKIVKGGFIFGAEGGKGVLEQVHNHINGYYTIAAASFGLQAGVQWFSYALFFMDASGAAVPRQERRLGGWLRSERGGDR